MTIELTMQPKISFQDKNDGTGFNVVAGYKDHLAQLQIGNVSIAFDDRNDWSANTEYNGFIIRLGEFRYDPVRLNNESMRAGDSAAENILRALAADLGFDVTKK